MTVLTESIGDYSQTIKISTNGNMVEVKKRGEVLFKGEATNIVDKGSKLFFKDNIGTEYLFEKYDNDTFA